MFPKFTQRKPPVKGPGEKRPDAQPHSHKWQSARTPHSSDPLVSLGKIVRSPSLSRQVDTSPLRAVHIIASKGKARGYTPLSRADTHTPSPISSAITACPSLTKLRECIGFDEAVVFVLGYLTKYDVTYWLRQGLSTTVDRFLSVNPCVCGGKQCACFSIATYTAEDPNDHKYLVGEEVDVCVMGHGCECMCSCSRMRDAHNEMWENSRVSRPDDEQPIHRCHPRNWEPVRYPYRALPAPASAPAPAPAPVFGGLGWD